MRYGGVWQSVGGFRGIPGVFWEYSRGVELFGGLIDSPHCDEGQSLVGLILPHGEGLC